jgi:hypothetical protein
MLKNLTQICKGRSDLDSHQVVEYWMCQMNLLVGQELAFLKTGIFRQAQMDLLTQSIPSDIPSDIAQTIQLIQCASASYVRFNPTQPLPTHQILNVESYLHVTSPIRRIVDIINMWLLQKNLGLVEFDINLDLTTNWHIDKINTQSQAIKRVQNKAKLLDLIMSRSDPDETLEGWVCLSQRDCDPAHQRCLRQTVTGYNSPCIQIYVPKYRLQVQIQNIDHTEIPIYSKCNLKLYLFVNSDTLDKKVRAELV